MSNPCLHSFSRQGMTACKMHGGRTISPGVCAHCDLADFPPCEEPLGRLVHADWCERYGLPTDLAQCTTCTAAREAGDAEYLQAMRARGLAYGASACQHREQTGTTITRTCCGGKAKELPVYTCTKLDATPAPCQRCRQKIGIDGLTAAKR